MRITAKLISNLSFYLFVVVGIIFAAEVRDFFSQTGSGACPVGTEYPFREDKAIGA
jgi:hypothetical protein